MRLHAPVSEVRAGRCRGQVTGSLPALEREWAERGGDWWFGERIGHADIALACALRFASEAHPDLVVRVTGYSAYFRSLSKEYRRQVVDRILAESV